MTIKVGDKEYCLDGYTNTSELQKVMIEIYQQGRADAIDEVIAMFKTDFDKQNRVNSLYVPTVVVNENIYIDLEQLKEKSE